MAKRMTSAMAALLSFSIMSCAGAANAADLTISLWGGGYGERFTEHLIKPFEEANGVEIAVDGGRSSERLSKLIATKGRGVDLVFLSDFQMYEAYSRGLIEGIDVANVPNRANLRDFAKDPFGGDTCPAFVVLGAGLAYNTDEFGDTPPSSWNDLLRTDLKGKAGYPDIGISYATLLAIQMAEMHGGGIDNVGAGFDALNKSRDNLQFYASREILESVVRGDVSLTPQLNIFVRKNADVPMAFAWPKEGGLGVLNLMCVVKGSKNADLAEKFVNYMLSDEVQNKLLNTQGETPVSANVDMSGAAEMSRNVLTLEDIEKLNFWDTKTISENKAKWVELWQETVVAN
ncbi:MAG: extracellular solute-binding protein [Alphaproteobacteria bacterium]|nr:extracellular solute-binding protein [Alphaproteobacteria bacterium]